MERGNELPTVSSAGGFRTGSAIDCYREVFKKIYGDKVGSDLIDNPLTTNPIMFEYIMGWPINWTSLKPLKKIIIPKFSMKNFLKIKPLKKVKYQKERISAIGNGQFPLCVNALLKLWLGR